MALRKGGATFREIAAVLGVTAAAARKSVLAELGKINAENREAAADWIALEAARLDRMHRAVWPDVCNGKLTAIDRMLAIMERRAKLLGLDKPRKIAVATNAGAGLASLLQEK